MTLRVIGAGVGRTGTASLKSALELLLGGPCYHMFEVGERPDDVAVWHAAARGEMPDWRAFFDGWSAAVDWPAAAFWPELAAAFPDAVILHSTRDAERWWESASSTIFPATLAADPSPWREMIDTLFERRFTARIDERDAALAAYAAHNAHVLSAAPAERLLEWQPGDGWEPLCAALGVAVPDADFPHANTTAAFHARLAERGKQGQ
ncbi:MAG: sulfotransferase family protein [Gammaproteobacteria bacterium]